MALFSKQDNTAKPLNDRNYLVTEPIKTNAISQIQVSSDLSILKEAEEDAEYRADISKNIKEPQVKVATSALRLSNPFKGV